jgi:sialic acid synthase SpsE
MIDDRHRPVKPNSSFTVGEKVIGQDSPTYFIADIGANHDGDLGRAKELIFMCAEAGADAAKFQHFKAETIVSDQGFQTLNPATMSHQANWKKSVFEVYQEASIDLTWTKSMKEACDKAGVAFMTTPYSRELVDHIDEFVPAYKIGSGDITWLDHIRYIAEKGKPVILACGASTFDETVRAIDTVLQCNADVAILQCNTNYTASLENFNYINLNFIKTLSEMYPSAVLGLSDHTPGHSTALGAVTLGGRVIEKHFTDDNDRVGPDHKFAMDPKAWREMVDATRELERALGNGIKQVEENEKDTVTIQRRSLRASKNLEPGHTISIDDIEVLRPCPDGALEPRQLENLIGRTLRTPMAKGDHYGWRSID